MWYQQRWNAIENQGRHTCWTCWCGQSSVVLMQIVGIMFRHKRSRWFWLLTLRFYVKLEIIISAGEEIMHQTSEQHSLSGDEQYKVEKLKQLTLLFPMWIHWRTLVWSILFQLFLRKLPKTWLKVLHRQVHYSLTADNNKPNKGKGKNSGDVFSGTMRANQHWKKQHLKHNFQVL